MRNGREISKNTLLQKKTKTTKSKQKKQKKR